jgi:hypothetical protein
MTTPTPLRQERTMEEWAVPAITLGLKALQDQSLLWVVTIAAGVGWSYTIIHPDPWRIVAATVATVTVLFPFVLRRGE